MVSSFCNISNGFAVVLWVVDATEDVERVGITEMDGVLAEVDINRFLTKS